MTNFGVETLYIQDVAGDYVSHPDAITEDGKVLIKVKGYSDYFCINEKIYETEPTRTLDFSIPDINNIETKDIPHIYIQFKYLSIEQYHMLVKLLRFNEFVLKYYDIEDGKIKKGKFYLKPRDRATMYARARDGITNPLGIIDFSLEFVATLNE